METLDFDEFCRSRRGSEPDSALSATFCHTATSIASFRRIDFDSDSEEEADASLTTDPDFSATFHHSRAVAPVRNRLDLFLDESTEDDSEDETSRADLAATTRLELCFATSLYPSDSGVSMSPVFRVDAEPTKALNDEDEDANVLFVETPILVEHNVQPTEPCFFVMEYEKATIRRDSVARKRVLRRTIKEDVITEFKREARERAARPLEPPEVVQARHVEKCREIERQRNQMIRRAREQAEDELAGLRERVAVLREIRGKEDRLGNIRRALTARKERSAQVIGALRSSTEQIAAHLTKEAGFIQQLGKTTRCPGDFVAALSGDNETVFAMIEEVEASLDELLTS
jgi:hypothetical protein